MCCWLLCAVVVGLVRVVGHWLFVCWLVGGLAGWLVVGCWLMLGWLVGWLVCRLLVVADYCVVRDDC